MASCLASSVLPTPVGPVNRKQPAGRSGMPRPARDRLMAAVTSATASSCPNTTRPQRLLQRAEPFLVRRGRLARRDVGDPRDDLLDLGDVHGQGSRFRASARRLRRHVVAAPDGSAAGSRLHPHHRAGFVQQVDGADPAAGSRAGGVPPASRPPRWPPASTPRGGALRIASAAPAGCCTVSSTVGSCSATFWKRRDSARSFSICLNSSNVVEPTTRRPPAVSTGFSSVARSIVPPVVAPAPTMLCSSSMNRIGFFRLPSAVEDGLEALFEVAAEARAGEQRRRVEREDFGARQRRGHVRLAAAAARALRPSRSCRRPASPTNTGPFFRRRQRISIVRCSSFCRPISGSSRPAAARSERFTRVGRQRIARDRREHRRRPASAPAHRARRAARRELGSGTFRMPWEM